jgi:hypothetical protein
MSMNAKLISHRSLRFLAQRAKISVGGFAVALFVANASCASRTMNENGRVKNTTDGGLDDAKGASTSARPKADSRFRALCGSTMTQSQYEELLDLSDVKTFTDFRDAARRSERIAEVFAEAKDRRGVFASMYVEITKESVGSSVRGEYSDNVKAGELVKRFADRYFEPLHGYLLNGAEGDASARKKHPVNWEWQKYYDMAEDCSTSDLRLLGTGVNNHMTMDLPYALSEIEAPESFEDDFMKFGNILILKKRESTDLLETQQNVYAAAFFDLFFVGKVIDGLFPNGTAATWGFQLIRAEAWSNGRSLQNPLLDEATWLGIRSAWGARQGLLALMPQSNPSMKGTEEETTER